MKNVDKMIPILILGAFRVVNKSLYNEDGTSTEMVAALAEAVMTRALEDVNPHDLAIFLLGKGSES